MGLDYASPLTDGLLVASTGAGGSGSECVIDLDDPSFTNPDLLELALAAGGAGGVGDGAGACRLPVVACGPGGEGAPSGSTPTATSQSISGAAL